MGTNATATIPSYGSDRFPFSTFEVWVWGGDTALDGRNNNASNSGKETTRASTDTLQRSCNERDSRVRMNPFAGGILSHFSLIPIQTATAVPKQGRWLVGGMDPELAGTDRIVRGRVAIGFVPLMTRD